MVLANSSLGVLDRNRLEDRLEEERAENMRRNREMMEKFGLLAAVNDFELYMKEKKAAGLATNELKEPEHSAGPSRQCTRGSKAEVPAAKRRLSRLANSTECDADEDSEEEPDEAPKQMTQEEYLKSRGKALPEGWFESDGCFTGWVDLEVVAKFGLAASAAEAWKQGGGGVFKRKISKSDLPAHLRKAGWSDARAFAAGQLQKNPNAYFYRHTAPGRPQAQGEWTQEEHDLFMQTARKYGVGDKWGLFASYIPNRVGYQCSAYYTQVIIPSGLIVDKRFRVDSSGHAVFVGARSKQD